MGVACLTEPPAAWFKAITPLNQPQEQTVADGSAPSVEVLLLTENTVERAIPLRPFGEFGPGHAVGSLDDAPPGQITRPSVPDGQARCSGSPHHAFPRTSTHGTPTRPYPVDVPASVLRTGHL